VGSRCFCLRCTIAEIGVDKRPERSRRVAAIVAAPVTASWALEVFDSDAVEEETSTVEGRGGKGAAPADTTTESEKGEMQTESIINAVTPLTALRQAVLVEGIEADLLDSAIDEEDGSVGEEGKGRAEGDESAKHLNTWLNASTRKDTEPSPFVANLARLECDPVVLDRKLTTRLIVGAVAVLEEYSCPATAPTQTLLLLQPFSGISDPVYCRQAIMPARAVSNAATVLEMRSEDSKRPPPFTNDSREAMSASDLVVSQPKSPEKIRTERAGMAFPVALYMPIVLGALSSSVGAQSVKSSSVCECCCSRWSC
jgi:hypothetical protein